VAKNLYVGNMSYDTTQERLLELFQEYGDVASVNIITDRDTGRPRGFAFVEMATDQAAAAAIAGLDGQEVDGRTLTVNEARPRAPRGGGREGGRGGGGRDRGRGGGGRDRGRGGRDREW
jgi:RNA recognition motif-containing protein